MTPDNGFDVNPVRPSYSRYAFVCHINIVIRTDPIDTKLFRDTSLAKLHQDSDVFGYRAF